MGIVMQKPVHSFVSVINLRSESTPVLSDLLFDVPEFGRNVFITQKVNMT